MSYTETAERDFIPTNLKTGFAATVFLDDYNHLTFTMDANKLLVPTAPAYGEGEDDDLIVSGFDPNVGVASGILQSFYDAPGIVERQGDGTYLIEPGQHFPRGIERGQFGRRIGVRLQWRVCGSWGILLRALHQGKPSVYHVGSGHQVHCFGHRLELFDRDNAAEPSGQHVAVLFASGL